jgi:hypothetical protein
MADQELPQKLLLQRIRNRIIEYLELAASADEQRDYERRVPIAHVPNEMINQWEDWVNGDDLDRYGPPVFSEDERRALRSFNSVLLAVADERPIRCRVRLSYCSTRLSGRALWPERKML